MESSTSATSTPKDKGSDGLSRPSPGLRRHIGWIVAGSLATGLVAALVLVTFPFIPAEERDVTDAVLCGFALGSCPGENFLFCVEGGLRPPAPGCGRTPVLAGANRQERALKMTHRINAGPRPPDCSVTVRSVKGAEASLRDRASSTLDPPDADQGPAGCQGDGHLWSRWATAVRPRDTHPPNL